MQLILIGLLLWCLTHFFPSLLRPARNGVIAKIGEGPYKGLFSLSIIASILLMVFGWRSIGEPVQLYQPPTWGPQASFALMFLVFYLFGAANIKTNIKQFLRHPQLTSIVLWGVAHLLSNGDARSVALFGGLAIWAVIMMQLINSRTGAWVKPDKAPFKSEVILFVISALIFIGVLFGHEYISGVSPFPS